MRIQTIAPMKAPILHIPSHSSESHDHTSSGKRGPYMKFSLLLSFVLALGTCYLCLVLPVLELLQSDRGWLSSFGTFGICLAFATPGLLLLYAINDLRKQVSRQGIINLCGVLYGALALVLGFVLLPLFLRELWGADVARFSFGVLFVALVVVLPIYVAHVKCLMREAGIEPQPGELLGRQTLQLMAFLMGMGLMGLLSVSGLMSTEMALGEYGNLMAPVSLLLVLLLPYLFYRISVCCFLPKHQ
jgi:hypothetical protein